MHKKLSGQKKLLSATQPTSRPGGLKAGGGGSLGNPTPSHTPTRFRYRGGRFVTDENITREGFYMIDANAVEGEVRQTPTPVPSLSDLSMSHSLGNLSPRVLEAVCAIFGSDVREQQCLDQGHQWEDWSAFAISRRHCQRCDVYEYWTDY